MIIVAEIKLDDKPVRILDMQYTGKSQRAWLGDLKNRWGDRVSAVEFVNAPRGWAKRAHTSVDHATYDELKSMLEYVASIYTEVA